jgi:cobalt-zinc-cadmium efflux system membrane fusion protein
MSASTVLLVDDDEVLRQVLRRVLTRQGYRVVEAGHVAGALEAAREYRPDVALLDLCLPDGDGTELARQLHAESRRLPLVLMTAYPLRLRDHPELAQGFTRVLTKPLNLDELRQAIDSALAGAQAATPAGDPPLDPQEPVVPVPHEPALSSESPSGAAPTPPGQPTAAAGRRRPTAPDATPRNTQPPARSRTRAWGAWGQLAAVLLVLALTALGVAGIAGVPNVANLLKPAQAPAPEEEGAKARLVPGSPDSLELPAEVTRHLGVTTAPVPEKAEPRHLELSGSLAFDPNYLGRVQSRFAGEVVEIGTNKQPGLDPATGRTQPERPLQYGDEVKKAQLLAVVWSKDLGEKKSELVDALSQLSLDQETLTRMEQLYREGNTSEAVVRQARRNVSADLIAVARAERTLRVWRLPEEEIRAVKEEAKRVIARKGQHDPDKEKDWARVEVRAPFDGVIVEKNLTRGAMVDTTFDLYKVADLRKLAVYAHAYEEDLRVLEDLRQGLWPRLIPWTVRLTADPDGKPLPTDGIERIGYIVDPNQHTDLVMGLADNTGGRLRVGQFVTASVRLPAPEGVVSVPADAVIEDGGDSIVFVQPDPARLRYALKRVAVTQRFGDTVYVRSRLTEAQKKAGLYELKPGTRVVTGAAVELKAALEEAQGGSK